MARFKSMLTDVLLENENLKGQLHVLKKGNVRRMKSQLCGTFAQVAANSWVKSDVFLKSRFRRRKSKGSQKNTKKLRCLLRTMEKISVIRKK